ncbi:unnamed protein product, partial [Polarella glacialis]
MPRDLLVGLFDGSEVPLALQTSKRQVIPSLIDVGNGFQLPKDFDNDQAITDYEEALQDIIDNAGMMHPAVAMIAIGLAVLYDTKAAIDKDAKCYDKSIEYLTLVQQALMAALGPDGAVANP